jgi:RHS repeat-associated protein
MLTGSHAIAERGSSPPIRATQYTENAPFTSTGASPHYQCSAQIVTAYQSKEYEHIEYTPYGETWIERVKDTLNRTPFRFTGKERDEETGLYYYGARYLDPRTSRWLSTDPAMGEYVPVAPINDEARKRSGNLPGMGGIFNTVNMHVYHYAGNNPVKYTDLDGNNIISLNIENNTFFLTQIIDIAGKGFYFDNDNNLQIDETVAPGELYSKTARAQLISAIKNTEKTVYLKATMDSFFLGTNSIGRVMWVAGDKNSVVVFLHGPSGKPNEEYSRNWLGTITSRARAVGFIHEALGHALPTLGITIGSDAYTTERRIRIELNWGINIGIHRGGLGGSETAIINSGISINLNTARRMK